MKTRYKYLIGISIIALVITLDKLQLISLLSWLRAVIQFFGGDPNVILKKDTVFSSEVYGGTIQGLIAALAVWVAYWTYNRQQKQVLRDQLFQKRIEIYPIIYSKCLDLNNKLKNTDYGKLAIDEMKKLEDEVDSFPREIRYSYGVLISKEVDDAIRTFSSSGSYYLRILYLDAMGEEKIMSKYYSEYYISDKNIAMKLFKLKLDEASIKFNLNLDRLLNIMRDELGIDPLTNDLKNAVDSKYFSLRDEIYRQNSYISEEEANDWLEMTKKEKKELLLELDLQFYIESMEPTAEEVENHLRYRLEQDGFDKDEAQIIMERLKQKYLKEEGSDDKPESETSASPLID